MGSLCGGAVGTRSARCGGEPSVGDLQVGQARIQVRDRAIFQGVQVGQSPIGAKNLPVVPKQLLNPVLGAESLDIVNTSHGDHGVSALKDGVGVRVEEQVAVGVADGHDEQTVTSSRLGIADR